MPDNGTSIPKTIWFLWFQGLDQAPAVVRKCHESWVARNPGWRVVMLDDTSLGEFASVDYAAGNISRLSRQHKSDLLRLDLISHHGGVWVDATCFCVQPLDEWLVPRMDSGFFALHRPRPNRIISNWFLAAEPGNVLATRMFERMHAYWGEHAFRNAQRPLLAKVLTRLLSRSPRTRGWWFSPVVTDWLRVSPYFAFMYMFEKLVSEDPACALVWRDSPKVSAGPPHRLYRAGLLSPVTQELRAEIDRREVPVYKTAWNLGTDDIPADSVLGYLLEGADAKRCG
jgi:Capsular polysaccharide synthesis protein